jgi:hypothetical protein
MSYIDMGKSGPEGSASAQVIGSSKHQASALYGAGDIIFLNKGSKDGVSEGQIFDIYIDRTIRDNKTAIPFATVSSGKIKVAKVSSTISTGVLLSAIDSIQQGDRVQAKMGYTTSSGPEEMTSKAPARGDAVFDLPPDDSGSDAPADDPGSDFDLTE